MTRVFQRRMNSSLILSLLLLLIAPSLVVCKKRNQPKGQPPSQAPKKSSGKRSNTWTFTDISKDNDCDGQFQGRPSNCYPKTTRLFALPEVPGRVSIQLFVMTPGYYPTFYVYSKEGSKYSEEKCTTPTANSGYFTLDNESKKYIIEVGISNKSQASHAFPKKKRFGQFILLVSRTIAPVWEIMGGNNYEMWIKVPRNRSFSESCLSLSVGHDWKLETHQNSRITIGKPNYNLPMYFRADYGAVGVFYDNALERGSGKQRKGIVGICPSRKQVPLSPFGIEAEPNYFEAIVFKNEITRIVCKLFEGLKKDNHPKINLMGRALSNGASDYRGHSERLPYHPSEESGWDTNINPQSTGQTYHGKYPSIYPSLNEFYENPDTRPTNQYFNQNDSAGIPYEPFSHFPTDENNSSRSEYYPRHRPRYSSRSHSKNRRYYDDSGYDSDDEDGRIPSGPKKGILKRNGEQRRRKRNVTFDESDSSTLEIERTGIRTVDRRYEQAEADNHSSFLPWRRNNWEDGLVDENSRSF